MKDKTDITIETYNNIVDEFENYYQSEHLNNHVPFQKEIDFLVARLPNFATILDAGTAFGHYPRHLTAPPLAQKSFDITGIDASNKMIIKAKTNAPKAKFFVMDVRNIDFPKKSFDAIICFATLIHLNDQDCINTLNIFDNILKNNGFIAINVMEQNNQDKDIFIDEPLNPKFKTYFNRYTKDFFLNYFAKKGYKVLQIFDNNLLGKEEAGEALKDLNEFSIIVQK